MVKNVAAYYPCLNSLLEVMVKRFTLIALTKEVSKIPSRAFVLWLNLMKSILIKYSNLRKETYKIYGLSIKWAPGRRMGLNPM